MAGLGGCIGLHQVCVSIDAPEGAFLPWCMVKRLWTYQIAVQWHYRLK